MSMLYGMVLKSTVELRLGGLVFSKLLGLCVILDFWVPSDFEDPSSVRCVSDA
jgi:hypothetical protein